MAYGPRKTKISQFTAGSTLTGQTKYSSLQDGLNKTFTLDQMLEKVAEVYGASFRVYEFESELVASDIAIGEYALVEETSYGLYKITSNAATGNDISLDSGFTATWENQLGGFVIGPASSTDDAIALYDGTSGALLKDGPAISSLALASDVATNTLAIANNFAAISVNATNISTNSTNITNNTDDISHINSKSVADYAAALNLNPADYAAGEVIYIYGDGIAGNFVVTTGAISASSTGVQLSNATWNAAGKHLARIYDGKSVYAGWFGCVGDYDLDLLTGTDDTTAFQAAVNYAATIVSSPATGVKQTTAGEVICTGMHGITALDIPTGVKVTGDPSCRGFVDIGTSTARACIEVGDSSKTTFSAFCGLVNCMIQGNTTTNRITVRYTYCIRKCFFNGNNLFGGWRLLDTQDSWALEFKSNYIWDAVESCVYLDNGTANNWQDNRIEVSGGPVVVIDGQNANEPTNVVFNGGAIQSGSEEGIKGIDVLSLELNGVFLESNNQDGGFSIINLVQGTNARVADYFRMQGGFCSVGTGAGGTFLSADAKAVYMNTEVRGNGFTTLAAVTSNTRVLDVRGTYPSVAAATPFTGYTEGLCEIYFSSGDRQGKYSNVTLGRLRNKTRTVTASTTATEEDNRILCSTAAGALVYTLRDADFTDGRKITLRKYTNDANALSVSIAGTTGKSLVGSTSKTAGYATIEIELVAATAFCF